MYGKISTAVPFSDVYPHLFYARSVFSHCAHLSINPCMADRIRWAVQRLIDGPCARWFGGLCGVYWLSVPEGGSLPNAGLNMAGTGSWFDAYGGLCSGKQAPFGFWCSGANPRTNAPNDYQAPYEAPGGFSFDSKTSRVANWSKPVGAVFHFHAGFCELASSLAPLQTPPVRFTGLCVSLTECVPCSVAAVPRERRHHTLGWCRKHKRCQL